MSINKEQLLALSPQERVALAEELWSSVESELLPITQDDIKFANDRLKLHQAEPNEGLSLEEVKNLFREKYGF